jgi:purine-binding chemotaxis protein CheW
MTNLYVLFRVGDTEYALPASDVLQMESFSGATPVPGTATYVVGLVQVRGRVVPVVDLRIRFGLPAVERSLDSRIVIVQNAGRAVGLLVDSARDVVHLADEDLQPPPELLVQQSRGFVKSIGRADERLVMLIDSRKVVGEEVTHAE